MGFEVRVTVRTGEAERFMNWLAERGCVVLDTGERVTTEEGIGAEAALAILVLDPEAELAVPA